MSQGVTRRPLDHGLVSLLLAFAALSAPVSMTFLGNPLQNFLFNTFAVQHKGAFSGGETAFRLVSAITSPVAAAAMGVFLAVSGVVFAILGLRSGKRVLPITGLLLNLAVTLAVVGYTYLVMHSE